MTQKNIQRALISVSDKQGIIPFARQLHECGIEIISTGGTCQLLLEAGIPVVEISSYTGFPELMDGRLKTLHPKVHGGILGRRSKDAAVAEAHGIGWIDLVVVNLYPFAETIQKPHTTFGEAIEQIDIGGPTMIRSAAKNMADVTVVVDPRDYDLVFRSMITDGGVTDEVRKTLATKAFDYTARYDSVIHQYLQSTEMQASDPFPEQLDITLSKAMVLRYGENPHQSACAYQFAGPAQGLFGAVQHQGKTLSYNNLVDADAAIACVQSFDTPACVIVKHANPCGVGCGVGSADAFQKALKTDPVSAFGGIVALNRSCDAETASLLCEMFFEVVIAPSFTEDALGLLSQKNNLRVLALPLSTPASMCEYQSIQGGMLIQYNEPEDALMLETVTEKTPSSQVMRDLLFAWRAVKHVKSNAILLAKDNQVIGIGAGQVSRIDAVDIAIRKATQPLAGAVLASDAFFPFRDSIDRLAETGIAAIIQPGGSIRDQEVIAACNEHQIAMVMTGIRCFKH